MLLLTVINIFLLSKIFKINCLNFSRNFLYIFIPIAITLPCPVQSDTFNLNGYGNVIINEEKNHISILANDVPFIELLKSIERYNGTNFKGINIISNHNISVSLNASNWNEVFKKLLNEYSWISVTNKTKTGSMAIYILPESTQINSTTTPFPIELRSEFSDVKSITGLTKNQLTRISNGALRSPLPIDLFTDNKIKLFLNTFGIETYEDLNDSRKAMAARSNARHELRKILK